MKGKAVSGLMVYLLFIGILSLVLNVARCTSAPEELLSLPAGATNSENGTDIETMLLSIDVDLETLGNQQEATVSPGGTIDVTITFQVWSSGGPGIIKQAFFIYSWTPSWPPPSTHYEPLYNGLPGYHPGVTQTSSFSLTVPEEAGTYYLWFGLGAHYSMEQAVNQYTTTLTLPAHAKIIVAHAHINIGEWTSDGRIELCVHSFHTSPSIDYYPYTPSTGCIFAWVDLSIRNVGTEDVSTNSLYGYLRDTDNYVYGEEGTLAPKRLALIGLPPGETIRGEIYFEVPTEAVIDDFLWIDLQSDMSIIIPEFPSFLILPLFMIATLLAVIFYRRKHSV